MLEEKKIVLYETSETRKEEVSKRKKSLVKQRKGKERD